MSQKTPLLFPVEILNRDLDYKLLLACKSLTPGTRNFVGQHDAIFRLSQHLQGGVYVGKNIFLLEWPMCTLDRYTRLKQSGIILVHLDEEGAVYNGMEEEWKTQLWQRVDPRVLASEDYMCTWGEFQRDHYKSLEPACADNIFSTGHPKFDLYKNPYRGYYEDQVQPLRDKYGDFILLNSNFGYVNYKLGTRGAFNRVRGYHVHDAAKRTQFINTWAHDSTLFAYVIRMINRLTVAFPDHNIVVRPHPCEVIQTYNDIFAGLDRIHVVHEGSVAPWLAASRVMIHNGCTTAIEAHFMDTPVVTYQPLQDDVANLFLPNVVGTISETEDQVIEQVRGYLTAPERQPRPAVHPWTRRLISNCDSSEGLDKVVSIIAEAEARVRGRVASEQRLNYAINETIYRAYTRAKKVVRPLFPDKERLYQFLTSPEVFAGFSRPDIERRVQAMSTLIGKKIDLTYHSEEMFSLEAGVE